jgi:uncharacterized membrane protein
MTTGPETGSVPAKQIVEAADPQLLDKLKPEQRESVLRVVQQVATSFEGPLPPPQMLAEYDRLIPNGADRMMKLLESQTNHRLLQESRSLEALHSLPARGQWIGTFLCLFFGSIGWHLSIEGRETVAALLFSTTIIGLVTVFVLGRAPSSRREVSDPPVQSKPGTKKRK